MADTTFRQSIFGLLSDWHGLDSLKDHRGTIMDIGGLIILLVVGAIAGWLAGQIVRGFGFGLLGNIVVGIVGAFIAGLIFPRLGISFGSGILDSIIWATLGAVILLFLLRLVRSA